MSASTSSSSSMSNLLVHGCFKTGLANGEATNCLFRAVKWRREKEREGERGGGGGNEESEGDKIERK